MKKGIRVLYRFSGFFSTSILDNGFYDMEWIYYDPFINVIEILHV